MGANKKIVGIVLCLFMLLTSCGGGGDGESQDSVAKSAKPMIDVSDEKFANAGDVVKLEGTATDDVAIDSVIWQQQSGVSVDIANADQLISTFIAPTLEQGEQLSFSFTATDSDGQSVEYVAFVTINPHSEEDKSVAVQIEDVEGIEYDKKEYLIVSGDKAIKVNNGSSEIALSSTQSEIVTLTDEFGNPILASYVPAGSESANISIESSVDLFVMKAPNFYGIKINDIEEFSRRIRAHEKYSKLVATFTDRVKLTSCPMNYSCNLRSARIAEQIANEIEYTDLIEKE